MGMPIWVGGCWDDAGIEAQESDGMLATEPGRKGAASRDSLNSELTVDPDERRDDDALADWCSSLAG
jgi:hypothetical protein